MQRDNGETGANKTHFSADVLTCQSRKSTGGINDMNNGCIPFLSQIWCFHAHLVAWLTGTINEMEPLLTSIIPSELVLKSNGSLTEAQ